MKGVHVKWSVLRWAEGQSFVLCDPRCKLLYSQGKERVNRSIVHCWITCKCCNYMYICLIFFCTLSSFSITFLCCDFVYFWLCTLLKVFLFALVYYHDTFHSLCTVSFCIVYLILFIPSSFRKRCHNFVIFQQHQYWIWYRPLLWSTEWVTEDFKPIVLLTKCMSIL